MPRQLIIHDDIDVVELAAKAVESVHAKGCDVATAFNLADGRTQIARHGDDLNLVVVGALIRQTPQSGAGSGNYAAVRDFVRDLKRDFPEIPLIVLCPTADAGLSGLLSAYEQTALLVFGAEWRDQLEQLARDLKSQGQPRGQFLELEIIVESPSTGLWRLECSGPHRSSAFGPLVFSESSLRSVLELTAQLEAEVAESGSVHRIADVAEVLESLLFIDGKPNRKLWKRLTDLRNRVGGMQNMRVIFTVTAELQQILLEALRDEPGNGDFWMLQAPMVRQYNHAGDSMPLFIDEQTRRGDINCLVIAAHPAGGTIRSKNWNGKMGRLKQLNQEAEKLQGLLESAKTRGCGIGRIEVARIDPAKEDPMAHVQRLLADGPWHLVHFAGHSITGRDGTGGLVLSAKPRSVLPLSDFVTRLQHTQFLFLSSCQSATPSFLHYAVQQVVPAVLGFRWPVEDDGAQCYAASFYNALFERGSPGYKSLEYAFLQARQDAYARNASEPTWASPLFITQLRTGQSPSSRLH